MRKTWIVYRDGDAGTEQHLAIVNAAQFFDSKLGTPARVFRDDKGRPLLYVANDPWLKVRELGAEP